MIKNVVFHGSGIVRKQVQEYKQINDFKTYLLKDQLNDLHSNYSVEDQETYKGNLQLLAEINNYLFPICFLDQINLINEYNSERILNQLTEQFNKELKEHKYASRGMAQYLHREDELKKNEEYREQQEQNKRLERQRLEEEKERQEKQKYNAELDQAEIDLLEGKKINSSLILGLFDRYDIKLPLRTRGWVINKLRYISQTNYRANSHSTKIFDYVEELVNKLNEIHQPA